MSGWPERTLNMITVDMRVTEMNYLCVFEKHFHCNEHLRYLFHKEMWGYGGSKDKENSKNVCVRMYSKM